jgi:phosphohistidine phosphatase
MKSLTLFRHAKTERDSDSGRDFDRRLNERGREDAPRMGDQIRELGLGFDLVLSSPAARAAETAQLAGLAARYDQRIYEASTGDLLAIVQQVSDEANRMAMVGHNPGFERLASLLIGGNIVMPTGSLVEIELPIDSWRDAGMANGRLVRFLKPKELG